MPHNFHDDGAVLLNPAAIDYSQPIKAELYSIERLEEYAVFLADQLVLNKAIYKVRVKAPSLLRRMKRNGETLLGFYKELSRAIHNKEAITPAAEWLTDNFHIVEEQLREIHQDLPSSFYHELPKLDQGDLMGYPRVYAIALALIAHTDSKIELETITRFINSYQTSSPLKTGELWALAITLRIALVENLTRISRRIILEHQRQSLANLRADRFFATFTGTADIKALICSLLDGWNNPLDTNYAFLGQLSKRLRDQDTDFWPALDSVEQKLTLLHSNPEAAVNSLHQSQASNQISVANIITSMRLLSGLNWRTFFEAVSLVERSLRKDPIYSEMDFKTRDQYRHVIERISKKTDIKETTIADQAWAFVKDSKSFSTTNPKMYHIGYYLIGDGKSTLENHFSYKSSFNLEKILTKYPKLTYFGLLLALLTLSLAPPSLYMLRENANVFRFLLTLLVLFIPVTDLAIQIANLILNHLVRPRVLPKLELSHGIPSDFRTIVVIPTLLIDKHYISKLLEKLEVSYLGNSDPELFFALLTDLTDAQEEFTPLDDALIAQVADGITELNAKYPRTYNATYTSDYNEKERAARFHHFHRNRNWNPSENAWIGWERKRGKLHEFNLLIRGSKTTHFVNVQASQNFLKSLKLVITLDSDTQLPRDTAKKMIGASLHPLNLPVYDSSVGRITEGYGILQPRIGISLESSQKSTFSKIFSGFTGIDPYTTAVSDTYQDLFSEANYTGKGLYHVDAFEAALHQKVPENTMLSHDLFEGLFSRTGLLTDIELIDDFPDKYSDYSARAHRWIRGDWQIVGWLFREVKNEKSEWAINKLPFISRWKIFDNLRRSLVAPTLFLSFLCGWAVFPGSSVFWTFALFSLLVAPVAARAFIRSLRTI